uniref:Uncharacterized protein n=1 Tax=Glossina pallidipes TaxID=7398 RepID=A0A1B0A2P9_GLOPL
MYIVLHCIDNWKNNSHYIILDTDLNISLFTATHEIVTYHEIVLQLYDRWALDEIVQFLRNNFGCYLERSSHMKGSRMALYSALVWCGETGKVDDVNKFLNGSGCDDCVGKSGVWFAPVELGPPKQRLE